MGDGGDAPGALARVLAEVEDRPIMWLAVGVDGTHRFADRDDAVARYRTAVRAWAAAHGDPTGAAAEVAELPDDWPHRAVFADPDSGRPVAFSVRWEAPPGADAEPEDAEESWRRLSRWYPDIAPAGDAQRAWQAEFDRLRIPIGVHERSAAEHRHAASVGDRHRQAELTLNPWKRAFRLSFHTSETFWPPQLQGIAPDLAATAVAARMYMSGARLPEIAAAHPFLGSVALAEARERGDEREHTWLSMYENTTASHVPTVLAPFIALAIREPRLRALLPYTSHEVLSFGSTPTSPLNGDAPWIQRFDERHATDTQPFLPDGYVVTTPDNRTFIEPDAPAALARVLAELDG